jgi:hypothetical protein
MPDRTQTLSVEREHVKRIAEAPMMLTEEQQFALRQSYEHIRKQCQAALSQSEHQGDEGLRLLADMLEAWSSGIRRGEALEDTNANLCADDMVRAAEIVRRATGLGADEMPFDATGKRKAAALRAISSRAQPPAPVLSDEERDQLKEAVFQLECAAVEADTRGEAVAGQRRRIAAAFLRTLASQEQPSGCSKHGVADCEDCYVEALAPSALASQEHRGEEKRKPASADEVRGILKGYSAPEPPEPDVDLHPMQGMGAHEAWMDGWAKGHAAATQPPAGELERLRERLLVDGVIAMGRREVELWGSPRLNDSERTALLRAALDAATSPPSDSQGDQERCGGCGKLLPAGEGEDRTGWAFSLSGGPWLCPDCGCTCGLKSTHMSLHHDQRCPRYGATVVPGCTCGHDGDGPHAPFCPHGPDCSPAPTCTCPEGGRSAQCPVHGHRPAPTQVEDCERCKGSGVELRQGCGEWISDPCPDCNGTGKRQPEGGDEEDWPPTSLVEALAGRYHGRMPFDERHTDEEVESRTTFRDAMKLARADLLAIRSFVPATSQDSSDLEAMKTAAAMYKQLAEERGARASKAEEKATFWEGVANKEKNDAQELRTALAKAEAERDRLEKLAAERLTLLEGPEPFRRAETALEELAEELDDEAAFEDRQAGRGELDERYRERCAARSATNEKAASLAREKAAKLKEGEQ